VPPGGYPGTVKASEKKVRERHHEFWTSNLKFYTPGRSANIRIGITDPSDARFYELIATQVIPQASKLVPKGRARPV